MYQSIRVNLFNLTGHSDNPNSVWHLLKIGWNKGATQLQVGTTTVTALMAAEITFQSVVMVNGILTATEGGKKSKINFNNRKSIKKKNNKSSYFLLQNKKQFKIYISKYNFLFFCQYYRFPYVEMFVK